MNVCVNVSVSKELEGQEERNTNGGGGGGDDEDGSHGEDTVVRTVVAESLSPF